MKDSRDLILGKIVYISHILDSIHRMVTIFSFDHVTGENREYMNPKSVAWPIRDLLCNKTGYNNRVEITRSW